MCVATLPRWRAAPEQPLPDPGAYLGLAQGRDEKVRGPVVESVRPLVQVYGLITVLPSESTTNHQHRTLIFSGVNSAGTQAAAEFFSSPENLLELRKHLKREGHDNFPAAYQVAVSAETDDNILLNFKYETHRVISTTPNH